MKFLKIIFVTVIGLFILFIVWMNLTPGHYQVFCGTVAYSNHPIYCGLYREKPMSQIMTEKFYLFLDNFDFNK